MFSTSLRRVLPPAFSFARNATVRPVADSCAALVNHALVRRHRPLTTSAPHRAPAEAVGQPTSGFEQTIRPRWMSIDDMVESIGQNPSLRPYFIPQKENPEEVWRKRSQAAQRDAVKARDAYYGRSVNVKDGEVANAYRKMNTILTRNNVRRELKMTERHEKKGVKRRRLSSEQWRKRFAHEVRKKVQLVQAIRARGG